jgi:endonuclease-3
VGNAKKSNAKRKSATGKKPPAGKSHTRTTAKAQTKTKPKVAAQPSQKSSAKLLAKKPNKPSAAKKKLAEEIRKRLESMLPEPLTELDHRNAYELLVATILSAQSTDRTVNRVTPALFEHYPTPAALAAADQAELEAEIKPTGFFRNKAKAIRAASQRIVEAFGGEVPRTMEEITTLPGVARKTGNVVLGSAYRVASGITIDTHAGRVARRLDLTDEEDPIKVELDLCDLWPQSSWIDMGHRFVLHGRYVCLAKKPRCEQCPVNEVCRSALAKPEGPWTVRAENERKVIEARGQAASEE